jgi:hypothetical protein
MGMEMALSEETVFDDRRDRIVNRSLAEYHVPVNRDVPDIEKLRSPARTFVESLPNDEFVNHSDMFTR